MLGAAEDVEPAADDDADETLAFVRDLMTQSGVAPRFSTARARPPASRATSRPRGPGRRSATRLGLPASAPASIDPSLRAGPAWIPASRREPAARRPLHLGAHGDHPRHRDPRPPAAGPALQQARRAPVPDRPGPVRRRALNPERHAMTTDTAPSGLTTARGATVSDPIADRLLDPPLTVRPDRHAHPRQRPQRALPARRPRRAHRRAGPVPAPPAGQPRLRPRPVGVDGRPEQDRARQAGGRRGHPPARGRGPLLGRGLRRPDRGRPSTVASTAGARTRAADRLQTRRRPRLHQPPRRLARGLRAGGRRPRRRRA